MNLKDLEPGVYKGQAVDWGVTEVAALDGKLQMWIKFELDNGAEITWKDFFVKKDGTPNKKTLDTLATMGFSGDIAKVVEPSALNTTKLFDITVSIDDNGYRRVDWVNDPDKPRGESLAKMDQKLAMRKLAGLNLKVGSTVPNFADKIANDDFNI